MDSFVFYSSWKEALSEMPVEIRVQAYDAICAYGCGEEIDLDSMNPWARSVLKTIIPQIDANRKRRENGMKGAESGIKGGRPRKTPEPLSDETPVVAEEKPHRGYDENPNGAESETPNVYVNVNEYVNDNVNGNVNVNTKKRFTPPSVEEVAEYCRTRNNGIDAEEFVAYYSQQGWKLSNGNPMKDWKSAITTWEKNRRKKPEIKKNAFTDYTHKSNYDLDTLEWQLTENPRLVAN